ncbi:methyl-accepting chemotaxis protein [Pseudomonas fluorescens]|nr:methyl-accepting chemotaxis protein [Pseudomonas fluorescens]MDZ5431918.1 methyl-accepting chemotaxis protein [Pseudomonas fluorescens]
MKNHSLHNKLFWTSLIGAVAVLVLLLGSIASITYDLSVKDAAIIVEGIVKANAKEIEIELGAGWTAAESVASVATAMQTQHIDRKTADSVTHQLFEANPQLIGMGHYWEPDAYDGKDSEFANQANHDASGRYLLYWNRTAGTTTSESLTGYLTENSNNQYYYRPIRTRQPWASEPFSYHTASDQQLMMISIMLPLIQRGKAVGAAGVDISLDSITRQLAKVDVFKGYGALVSTDGHYASHPDKQRVGLPADDLPAAAKEAIKAGQPFTFVRDGWGYSLQPVHIGKAPNVWALVVAYPLAQAMANIDDFLYTAVLIGLAALLILAIALWYLMAWQIRPLVGLTGGIQSWGGELGLRFEQHSDDETGKLAGAFNQFIKRLADLVGSIRLTSTALINISTHLHDTTQAVAGRATFQHTATEEMASGVTALAHSVTEMSRQAEDVEHLARNTELLTSNISKEMSLTLSGIRHIDQTMDVVSGTVESLEQRSQQIAGIIAVIRSIADQTNLLALNAAIEAARAGEQGRGFAVVADEVRQLAERTSRSTGEIGMMIGAIGLDVRNTVDNVRDVGEAVRQGVAQLTTSAKGVDQIRQHATDILTRISEVSRQTQSQAATGEQLSVAIQGVSRISEQNDVAIRSLLDESRHLSDEAGSLNLQLKQFRD